MSKIVRACGGLVLLGLLGLIACVLVSGCHPRGPRQHPNDPQPFPGFR